MLLTHNGSGVCIAAVETMLIFPPGQGAIVVYSANDLARVIHNADARVLDRYVQSSKWSMLRFAF